MNEWIYPPNELPPMTTTIIDQQQPPQRSLLMSVTDEVVPRRKSQREIDIDELVERGIVALMTEFNRNFHLRTLSMEIFRPPPPMMHLPCEFAIKSDVHKVQSPITVGGFMSLLSELKTFISSEDMRMCFLNAILPLCVQVFAECMFAQIWIAFDHSKIWITDISYPSGAHPPSGSCDNKLSGLTEILRMEKVTVKLTGKFISETTPSIITKQYADLFAQHYMHFFKTVTEIPMSAKDAVLQTHVILLYRYHGQPRKHAKKFYSLQQMGSWLAGVRGQQPLHPSFMKRRCSLVIDESSLCQFPDPMMMIQQNKQRQLV